MLALKNFPTAVLASLLTLAITFSQSTAQAQACSELTIQAPTPFLGNDGEIVKFSDGSYWEVTGSFLYLYAYYPRAVLCPSSGQVIVNNKAINLLPVSGIKTQSAKGKGILETTIVSKFEGLNLGNVYKMANGQVWEQTEGWIWLWIWVNPTVMIYEGKGGYLMKVENIEHPVSVRRVK